MDVNNLDFEGTEQGVVDTPSANDTQANPANQPDSTSLSGTDVNDVTGKDNTNVDTQTPIEENTNTTEEEPSLAVGTEIEFDGATYTVSENGDIVDNKGNVFKEKKDVKEWLEQNNIEDSEESNDVFSIANLQKEIGIDVTDEQGNPIEFTNDAAGVKSYVNSVIELKSNEIRQGAINKLFNDAPVIKEFVDYITLTGGDPRGFGNLPDRSGIQLDKENELQLEAVIKMAGREFGNPNINDNYIKYLKSTGSLYDEAKQQLDNLIAKDQQLHAQIAQEAERAREQEAASIQQYWSNVAAVISTRSIGGYKLPESFVKNNNGQKITVTPDDFFNYLYRDAAIDESGNRISAYQRDLYNLSDEEALNKELLDAWLMFTGGSYKDLINMATNEQEVRKLKIKSNQQRNAKTIKVVKPKSKVSPEDIIF